MNWAWATSLDQLWRSPTFPMWLTLAAAGFFAVIALITLLRAEKSVANGALTVIALLAVGIAVAATIRPDGRGGSGETLSGQAMAAALPALSCIDDLAGETVLMACEKTLFGSAESTAAALSYAASQITRITASGDAAGNLTTEQMAVRRAVERDRYGLMAYVLAARDHCTATECAAFRSLTDHLQIVANMNDRVYEGLVMRYSASWNAPPPTPVAAASPSPFSGKPTNADFPTAASTPAVTIMVPEPGNEPRAQRPPAALASAPLPSPRSPTSSATAATLAPAQTAAKKQSAAKRPPAPSVPAPAADPAPSND